MPLLGSVLALHFIKIVFPLPLEKQVLKYSLLYYLVPFSLWAVHTRPWVLKSHAAVLCLVTQLCTTLCNPRDCSLPHSSVHGDFFFRQEYWSRLPCSPPGDLPNPRTEPRSPTLQADYLPSEPPGKPINILHL